MKVLLFVLFALTVSFNCFADSKNCPDNFYNVVLSEGTPFNNCTYGVAGGYFQIVAKIEGGYFATDIRQNKAKFIIKTNASLSAGIIPSAYFKFLHYTKIKMANGFSENVPVFDFMFVPIKIK